MNQVRYLLALTLTAAGWGPVGDDRVEEWTEDVIALVERIESMHPDPWFGTPREEFEGAVDELLFRIPELDDDQVVVELMRLVALLSREGRDGHAALFSFSFAPLPVQVYRFADGWFVVGDQSGSGELVGARVVTIDGHGVEEVAAAVAPLITKDNDTNLVGKQGRLLVSPRVLHALGLAREAESLTLGLEAPDGGGFEAKLDATPGRPRATLPPRGDVLWLRENESPFAMEVVDDALYVRYDVVLADDGQGLTLATFAADIVATFERMELDRVVIDVRSNGGGNNGTFGPLLAALTGDARLNTPERLFLLIGRHTFSAAGNFVTVFERETNGTLVGEPTGGAPNQYGDARQSTLPNHPDVALRISTRYHEFGGPDDTRLTHEPVVSVPLTSADYFAGRDPVLEAALRFGRD